MVFAIVNIFSGAVIDEFTGTIRPKVKGLAAAGFKGWLI
jgi:hypothetical protein